jgi:hypothetical protein
MTLILLDGIWYVEQKMQADSRSAGRGSRVGIQATRASLRADASAFLNACGLRAWTLNMG